MLGAYTFFVASTGPEVVLGSNTLEVGSPTTVANVPP